MVKNAIRADNHLYYEFSRNIQFMDFCCDLALAVLFSDNERFQAALVGRLLLRLRDQ